MVKAKGKLVALSLIFIPVLLSLISLFFDSYKVPPGVILNNEFTSYREKRADNRISTLIKNALVFIDTKEGRVDCNIYKNSRWRCKNRPDWQHVRSDYFDVDFKPQKMIWAHPPKRGETLKIELKDLKIRDDLLLLGAHTVHGASFAKADVLVKLKINDKEIYKVYFKPSYGIKKHPIKTSPSDRANLLIEISSSNNGANHFCFDLILK